MSGIRPARDKRTTWARHRTGAGIMIAANAATSTPTADSRLPRFVSMEPGPELPRQDSNLRPAG